MRAWLLSLCVLAVASAAMARTWTDATGKFSVEAEFVALDGEDVVLKKADGKELRVPLARLSEADQAFAQEAAAKPASAPGSPAVNRPKPYAEPAVALARRLSKTDEHTLEYLYDGLSEDINACIVLHPSANGSLQANLKFTADQTLAANLDAALKPLDLDYVVLHDAIVIGKRSWVQRDLTTPRVYRARQRNASVVQLAADITAKLGAAPLSLQPVVQPLTAGAVVVQTTSGGHQAIEREFARTLAAIDAPAYSGATPLDRALAKKGDIICVETPLEDVADYFSDVYRVPIKLNRVALEKQGVTGQSKVTIASKSLSLGSALSLVCLMHRLEWTRGNDGVTITTPSAAEDNATAAPKVYDIRGLTTRNQADDLTAAMENIFLPGQKLIPPAPGALPAGSLNIKAGDPTHRRLETFFAALRSRR